MKYSHSMQSSQIIQKHAHYFEDSGRKKTYSHVDISNRSIYTLCETIDLSVVKICKFKECFSEQFIYI